MHAQFRNEQKKIMILNWGGFLVLCVFFGIFMKLNFTFFYIAITAAAAAAAATYIQMNLINYYDNMNNFYFVYNRA